MRVSLLQQRDLIEQAMGTAGSGAIVRIHLLDGNGGVPGQTVVRANLAERVVHVRQLVGRNLCEGISRCRPVSVVTDDFQRLWGRTRALSGGAHKPGADQSEHRPDGGPRRPGWFHLSNAPNQSPAQVQPHTGYHAMRIDESGAGRCEDSTFTRPG